MYIFTRYIFNMLNDKGLYHHFGSETLRSSEEPADRHRATHGAQMTSSSSEVGRSNYRPQVMITATPDSKGNSTSEA